MKKIILTLFTICCSPFILLIAIIPCSVSAQSGNFNDYLPLQVGNIWVYQCSAGGNQCGYCSKRIKVKILNTSLINGKTYFQSQVTSIFLSGSCTNCGGGLLPFNSLIKIDSLSSNVLLYSSNGGCPNTPNEIIQDSLKARLHDTIRYNCQPPGQWDYYICSDTNNITIFGTNRQARDFSFNGFEGGWGRSYVKGIGLIGANMIGMACNDQTQLRGCIINGILYGDTGFVVGVNKISSEVPNSFSLLQNYPNPFNPSTKIRFDVPLIKGDLGGFITLIVYDALGKEVSTLVKEQLKPGEYEADFDGTNLPSGVYFYKLTVNNEQLVKYTETKKMVLIK